MDSSEATHRVEVLEGPVGDEEVDCGVVIVTYNSADDILRLLQSLPAGAGALRLRVVVVDNGSTDGTVGLVRTIPGVGCIETGANLGYAGAINVGREHLRPYRSLLLLNADLSVEPGAIDVLRRAIAQSGVGVAVPMLLNEHGALYPSLRREPTLTRAFGDAFLGGNFERRPGWLSEIVRQRDEYECDHSIDWATGAAMILSSDCDAAVGEWDDRFFLYSEETDVATRARSAGFRIEYVPAARVRHRGGGSGESAALVALMAVNRVRYFEKHHGRLHAAVFRAAVAVHELLRVADAAHRLALRRVVRRSTWRCLPSGRDAAT